jgi:transposase
MRATTIFRNILQIPHTRVWSVEFGPLGVVLQVAPTTAVPRCSCCGCRVHAIHDTRARNWRHLDACGMEVLLRYTLRRVQCPRCGVVIEMVPWAEPKAGFTRDFEDHVAYLAQQGSQTTVANTMRVAWRTVGAIIERVMGRRRDPAFLDGLEYIGVDELSYRKHHEYVTVVVDHVRERVVWSEPGKNAKTLGKFFDALGPERTEKLRIVTIDMSAAYIDAVTSRASQAQIVFDRFHVQRLAQNALDELRRAEVRRLEDSGERGALKKTRWALLKSPWNLSHQERDRLALLQRTNHRLYRGYLLKAALADILGRRQAHVARDKLIEWISWAARSRLAPFKKLAATIKKHLEGIVAIVATGLNNARTEGLNGKIRVITRRAYGFHSASALISFIFLCCSGLVLHPVFKMPPTAAVLP